MLPPGLRRGWRRRPHRAPHGSDCRAPRPSRPWSHRRRTARTSRPRPPIRACWFFTMRPSRYVSADGIMKIANIAQKLDHGVGFSNGCAELALKNPPPLVPSCLIDLLARDRPHGEGLLRALERHDVEIRLEVLDHALLHEEQRQNERQNGQQDVQRAAHEIRPRNCRCRPAERRAIPRTKATATAMPTAAEAKLWNANCVICEKYDIVVSPEYDCQLVLVVNDAAVSNACRSGTAARCCGLSGSRCCSRRTRHR